MYCINHQTNFASVQETYPVDPIVWHPYIAVQFILNKL